MVSGCFDLLHSGHMQFLERASKYGELYVVIGSDDTIFKKKKRKTAIPQDERKYMVSMIKGVHKVFIGKGTGVCDFKEEAKEVKPDIYISNFDSHVTQEKIDLLEELGITFMVFNRTSDFTLRSTTKRMEEKW